MIATYECLIDRREQRPWYFPPSDHCLGSTPATLKTGDYTLRGFEDRFVIERKASPSEMCGCLFSDRFERELVRLDEFEHPYLLLEFDIYDIINFPVGSGIPRDKWESLRVTPQLFLKRFHEIQLSHPRLHILPVGRFGRETASSLFKRIVEHYGKKTQ